MSMFVSHIHTRLHISLMTQPAVVDVFRGCLSSRCSGHWCPLLGAEALRHIWSRAGCAACAFVPLPDLTSCLLGLLALWAVCEKGRKHHCDGIAAFSLREHKSTPGSWFELSLEQRTLRGWRGDGAPLSQSHGT